MNSISVGRIPSKTLFSFHNERNCLEGSSKKIKRAHSKHTKAHSSRSKRGAKYYNLEAESRRSVMVLSVWKACITRIYFRAQFPLSFFSSVMFTVSSSKCSGLCFDISVWGLLNAPI
jgi:hypothetical protein